MQQMKTASIRDLHIRTSELVREAADGAVIVIQRRGQPVAELRPIPKTKQKLNNEWSILMNTVIRSSYCLLRKTSAMN